jgi:hypothetical protein
MQTTTAASRAVTRPISPGSDAPCAHCGDQIKFAAKVRGEQVIANVYADGRWLRVEHYHAGCYEDAGRPHGEPGS